jgi:energy-coupling factor transporter ATP-binding protein EcfA2
MSWAQKLQAKKEKAEEKPAPVPLQHLRTNINKAIEYCKGNRQDWVILITGNEGSGKSTLASHVCKMFDQDFSVDESIIYNFWGEDHSFLNFLEKFQAVPYKVAWYDEAVTVLFALRHSSSDSANAQELFKIKRDCRHFDILVTPSFWDVVPDIRERRAKSLIYCFTEIGHPVRGKTVYYHKLAYFSGAKISHISANKGGKVRFAFRSPTELFKLVRPDFIETFPAMDSEIEEEYMKCKIANRLSVLDRINNKTVPEKVTELLSETPNPTIEEAIKTLKPKKTTTKRKPKKTDPIKEHITEPLYIERGVEFGSL